MTSRWLLRRLLLVVFTLWGVSIVVFFMMHLAPGDPAEALLGPMGTPAVLEQFRERMGLADPLYIQYARWLGNVLHGDLGRSIMQQLPVWDLAGVQFVNTVILGVAGFSIAALGGLFFGFAAAVKRGSWVDRLVIVVASGGIALPPFFLALLLTYVFASVLGVLPAQGMHSLDTPDDPLDLLRHLVLPAVALALGPMAVIARMTRSSVLEVLPQDYVRTARAKGLSERVVARRHLLKNALIPLVHLLGLQVGILLSATALVEVVFSWPGIGSLMVHSILTRDLPLTQGCVLLMAAAYAVVSVAADVVHAALDPQLASA